MSASCSLEQFQNAILAANGRYIVFRVKRKYRRFLSNWAVEKFGANFPPSFTIRESLDDRSYSDFMFNQGTIQEQMNAIPIDYLHVNFYWSELLKYTFK